MKHFDIKLAYCLLILWLSLCGCSAVSKTASLLPEVQACYRTEHGDVCIILNGEKLIAKPVDK